MLRRKRAPVLSIGKVEYHRTPKNSGHFQSLIYVTHFSFAFWTHWVIHSIDWQILRLEACKV